MRRKLCQLGSDLVERKPNALRKNNECNPPEDSPLIASLASTGSL